MKKSFVGKTLIVVFFISAMGCKGEVNSELLHAAIQIIDNSIGEILTATLVAVVTLAAALYWLLRYWESKNGQIVLEINQLTKRHKELSEKYKLALACTVEESIDSQDQRLLKKIVKTMEDNIGDPGFKVERMAKEIGMSRTNLHRRVKALTGFPPSELLRNIRLRKAAELLLSEAESVTQIGYIVGFDDSSYFSKAFKKEFGLPPSEYLRLNRQSNKPGPEHQPVQVNIKQC
jgi:AraC-like DNA-binding protein